MKARLSLVAKEVIIDADSGVPSAICIMEAILSESFPLFLPGIAFLSVLSRDLDEKNEFSGTLKVLLGDNELLSHSAQLGFKGKDVARHVAKFQGLVIEKPGSLTFRLEVGEVASEFTIRVEARPTVSSPSESDTVGQLESAAPIGA